MAGIAGCALDPAMRACSNPVFRAAARSKSWSRRSSDMQRAILEQLMVARREGRVLVRALEVESGSEKLLDPASDMSALGMAAAAAAHEDVSRCVIVEGRTWLL